MFCLFVCLFVRVHFDDVDIVLRFPVAGSIASKAERVRNEMYVDVDRETTAPRTQQTFDKAYGKSDVERNASLLFSRGGRRDAGRWEGPTRIKRRRRVFRQLRRRTVFFYLTSGNRAPEQYYGVCVHARVLRRDGKRESSRKVLAVRLFSNALRGAKGFARNLSKNHFCRVDRTFFEHRSRPRFFKGNDRRRGLVFKRFNKRVERAFRSGSMSRCHDRFIIDRLPLLCSD